MKIFKLHNEKIDKLLSWGKEVQLKHLDEALESLKEENCSREIFEVFEAEGQWYLAAHMEGENISPANLDRELNQRHRAIIMDCIQERLETTQVYDLKV